MKHLLFVLIVLSFTPAEGSDKAVRPGTAAKAAPKEPAVKSESKTGKKVTYRKTQEVSFDGSDIDGQVRSPDGAYLLQKRGVKFMPLYKVNNQFEKNILESVEYLR
jgi:hypothetical protein